MNKYFTRRGDDGSSATMAGKRVGKDSLVFELLGTLDEASAVLNLAAVQIGEKGPSELLGVIQRDLQLIMAEAAGDKKSQLNTERIEWLEKEIERLGEGILKPGEFITAWTKPASAMLNLARTIVRRAERTAVMYTRTQDHPNPSWVGYLNRLSSLLFVLQLVMENPPLNG